ncbi:MAG: VPLPA-CTERM sorting domain-containing protein [Gammaproteobacteria bacterium]|nr:VPLPA-CTERM sorting domain-containing protein [Gammaproteobacteria bacterium]
MIYRRLIISSILIISTNVNAALIDRGNGMIYDSDLDITWLQDANYAQTSGYDADGLMNWTDAMAWADTLSYSGYSDWRLATGDTVCTPGIFTVCTGGELGHLFYSELGGSQGSHIFNSSDADLNLFSNIQANIDPFISFYWTSTETVELTLLSGPVYRPQAFSFDDGKITLYPSSENYAWAVRDGDVAAVPLPSSIWLLFSGLIGLAGLSKRNKLSFKE